MSDMQAAFVVPHGACLATDGLEVCVRTNVGIGEYGPRVVLALAAGAVALSVPPVRLKAVLLGLAGGLLTTVATGYCPVTALSARGDTERPTWRVEASPPDPETSAERSRSARSRPSRARRSSPHSSRCGAPVCSVDYRMDYTFTCDENRYRTTARANLTVGRCRVVDDGRPIQSLQSWNNRPASAIANSCGVCRSVAEKRQIRGGVGAPGLPSPIDPRARLGYDHSGDGRIHQCPN